MHTSLAAAAAVLATAGITVGTTLVTAPAGVAAVPAAGRAVVDARIAGGGQAAAGDTAEPGRAGRAARDEVRRPRYRYVPLPTRRCREEDSAGPCFWDAGLRGNGHGASFWRDANGHVHYLDYRRDVQQGWHPSYDRCHYDSSRPEPRACEYPFTHFTGWKRVSTAMSDALAEGEYGTARDWMRCIEHVGETTSIVCPDGFEITD